MCSRVRMFGLLTLVLVCSAESVVAQKIGRGEIPSRKTLDRYNLELLWISHAVIDATRDRVMDLVLDEESVYVQTESGFITALDGQTGARRWAQILARLDTPQLPLISNSETVLVNAGMSMFSVDKWTGGQRWRLQLPEQVSTSPAMDEERVFLATGSGSVYAFDLGKISDLYLQNKLPEWSYQARLWHHKTSKSIGFPPITHDGQITFASATKTLYSVNTSDDSLVFQMELPEPVTAPLIYAEGMLFIATGDQRVYCLDAQRGTTNWIFVSRSSVSNSPIVINRRCYVSPNDGSLYCLHLDTGVTLWEQLGAEHILAETENYVVSEDRHGNLLLLQPSAEQNAVQVVARLPMRDFSIRAENNLTDRIYLATPSGKVICLKEKGVGFPKFFKNPDKRPVEPIFADENLEAAADSNTDAF